MLLARQYPLTFHFGWVQNVLIHLQTWPNQAHFSAWHLSAATADEAASEPQVWSRKWCSHAKPTPPWTNQLIIYSSSRAEEANLLLSLEDNSTLLTGRLHGSQRRQHIFFYSLTKDKREASERTWHSDKHRKKKQLSIQLTIEFQLSLKAHCGDIDLAGTSRLIFIFFPWNFLAE